MPAPTTVSRCDVLRLDAAKVRKTPQGFLSIGGRLTRVGVLPYYRADGTVYRELRLPEEVFHADSLASLKMAPVTNLHVAMVTPENVGELQIGTVHSDVEGGRDGAYVTGTAMITHADAIRDVQSKRRCELSPGYMCKVDSTPGEWDGSAFGLGRQRYDGIQRGIVYNHLAIGPKDWGRSGNDVRLHLDGGGAIARLDGTALGLFVRQQLSLMGMTEDAAAKSMGIDRFMVGWMLDGFGLVDPENLGRLATLINVDVAKLSALVTDQEKGLMPIKGDGGAPAKRGFKMATIQAKLGDTGFMIELPDSVVPTFESNLAKLHSDAADAESLRGKLSAAEQALTDMQVNLDAATDPAKISEAVALRAALETAAAKIAPKLTLDAGDTPDAIRRKALLASGMDAARIDGKSEDFVQGAFELRVEAAPAEAASAASGSRAAGPVPEVKTREDGGSAAESDRYDSAAAQKRMNERNRNAWQNPKDASA